MSNPELNDLIGQRVRDARKRRRDMSVEEVVAECAKRGLPLTAGQMYLIETRGKEGKPRRRITVDELLTLAYVLEVSPLALLLPEEDGDYPVSGNVTARALAVYEWMIGARLPPKTADGGEDAVSADERAEAWSLLRRSLSYVPAQGPPRSRRLLCAVCIQVNRTEPDQHIYEAMTTVHGAMVCHEHFDILIKERKFDWAVLSVREYLRETREIV